MARGAAWTTSSSSGCGAASNTRRVTCMPMATSPRRRPASGPGWLSTTRSANIRAMAIARRGKCTKHNAGGYVDDRLCRPAALPPLPEPARKAGKCSPSPTSPPARPPTQGLIKRVLPAPQWRSEPTSKSAGLHLKTRLRLSHVRGPPHSSWLIPISSDRALTSRVVTEPLKTIDRRTSSIISLQPFIRCHLYHFAETKARNSDAFIRRPSRLSPFSAPHFFYGASSGTFLYSDNRPLDN